MQIDNRYDGVCTESRTVFSSYSLNATTEKNLGEVLASIFSAEGIGSWQPRVLRVYASATGVQLRSKTGAAGLAVPFINGGFVIPLDLKLAQGEDFPKTKVKFYNTTGGAVTLYVTLLV